MKMIVCPCRRMIVAKTINDAKFYDDCLVKLELLKIPKYRYYKSLYEGRIKELENIFSKLKAL